MEGNNDYAAPRLEGEQIRNALHQAHADLTRSAEWSDDEREGYDAFARFVALCSQSDAECVARLIGISRVIQDASLALRRLAGVI